MCQATGKFFANYYSLKTTRDFLEVLSRSIAIAIDLLVIIKTDGANQERGTWVHPQLAINLAQWCSPEFAVFTNQLIFDWMSGNLPPVQPAPVFDVHQFAAENKDRIIETQATKGKITVKFRPAKNFDSKAESNQAPEELPRTQLQKNLDRVIQISRNKADRTGDGWIKGRDISSGISGKNKPTTKQARKWMQELAIAGKGITRGSGLSLEYCHTSEVETPH